MKARAVVMAVALLTACVEGEGLQASEESVGVMWWEGSRSSPRSPPAPVPPPVGVAEATFEPAGAVQLTEVAGVNVQLRVSGLRGQGMVDAEFLAPGALVYEKRTRVVEAGSGEPRELRFSLPVAGTQIHQQGLAGRWEVRFFLNGQPLTTTPFTLER
jgi:hypothetical protein